jgi:hypothetical protein
VARPRRGRVPIDAPHLRGDDAENQGIRRLFVGAEQARRRRTAEKEKLLDELHEKGFAHLKNLRRGLSSARVGSQREKDLDGLYKRYKICRLCMLKPCCDELLCEDNTPLPIPVHSYTLPWLPISASPYVSTGLLDGRNRSCLRMSAARDRALRHSHFHTMAVRQKSRYGITV